MTLVQCKTLSGHKKLLNVKCLGLNVADHTQTLWCTAIFLLQKSFILNYSPLLSCVFFNSSISLDEDRPQITLINCTILCLSLQLITCNACFNFPSKLQMYIFLGKFSEICISYSNTIWSYKISYHSLNLGTKTVTIN